MDELRDTNTSQDLFPLVPRFDSDGRAYSPFKDSFDSNSLGSSIPCAPDGSYAAVDVPDSLSVPADGIPQEDMLPPLGYEEESEEDGELPMISGHSKPPSAPRRQSSFAHQDQTALCGHRIEFTSIFLPF